MYALSIVWLIINVQSYRVPFVPSLSTKNGAAKLRAPLTVSHLFTYPLLCTRTTAETEQCTSRHAHHPQSYPHCGLFIPCLW